MMYSVTERSKKLIFNDKLQIFVQLIEEKTHSLIIYYWEQRASLPTFSTIFSCVHFMQTLINKMGTKKKQKTIL